MTADTLKRAKVLAFERKLDPSDGLFYSGDWNDRGSHRDWPAVTVREKSVRGTISNDLKAKDKDPAKLDADISNPNPQTVDIASLPSNSDTLKITFTLRVLPFTGKPSSCNIPDYQAKLCKTVESYVDHHSFLELAKRYAMNLANGRFLWRNRLGAEAGEIRISRLRNGETEQAWIFDALALSLRDFGAESNDLTGLATVIAEGLSGKQHVLLQVVAFVRMGAGQEVFPSQELILDREKGEKSKTLYSVDNAAALHSQKIGNALRTIDTWYPEASENGPIAVEPYGSVTTQGKAYRQPKQKMDFYNLLDNWVLKDKAPELDQQHFVMATLIRGGVFGDAG